MKKKNKRKLSNKKKATRAWSNQISMQVKGINNKKRIVLENYFRSEKYYIDNNCYECPNCGMDIPEGYSECYECGWYRDKEEEYNNILDKYNLL
jgi:hypothetical protein